MSESTLALIDFLKIVWIGCFSFLYSLGGTEGYGKWLRRFVGSFWMLIGIFGFSSWSHTFHWWYLLYPILLCASLHIGYGGNSLSEKLLKRSKYGLAMAVSALPLCFPDGLWDLFGLHCCLCVGSSVFLGVVNPMRNARDEESLLAVLSTVCVLFLI